MVMNTKMNHCSWHRLKSMHNIINSPTAIDDIERRRMTNFASKRGRGWNHCHLTYDWNMSELTTPKCFIANGKAHEVLIIILHTHKWPKQQAFLYWLWLAYSKHGHRTLCPCLAFGKGCEHSKGWVTIQTRHPHWK
jgi:hypothetical protein